MSSKADDPKIRKFISASQLEEKYGGSAPNVTRYWPPAMPDYSDFNEDEALCKIHKREQYNEFYMSHPGLTLMPQHLREDLPPLVKHVPPPVKLLADTAEADPTTGSAAVEEEKESNLEPVAATTGTADAAPVVSDTQPDPTETNIKDPECIESEL